MFTDRLYTGQRQIAELGIYHYNARFYSPKLGRFLSADTLMSGFANPQNLNRFSYVANNPVRYTDPTGHMLMADTEGGGGGSYTPSAPDDYCATHPWVCGGGGGNPDDGGRDGGDTDTNGNGVPDVPDPNAVIPHPGHTCQYDNLVECVYSGGYWPSGDYTFTDEEWDAFTLAIYYDVYRQAHTGDGFWTLEYDPLGYSGDSLFVPFHTEAYYERTVYDTIFWNAGDSYSGNVCFGNGDCYDRTDVNYIAQGMWSAAAGEGPVGAIIVANAWKLDQYDHLASADANYWSVEGVTTYVNYNTFGPHYTEYEYLINPGP